MNKFRYCRKGSIIHERLGNTVHYCREWKVTGKAMKDEEQLIFLHNDLMGGETIIRLNDFNFHLASKCSSLEW